MGRTLVVIIVLVFIYFLCPSVKSSYSQSTEGWGGIIDTLPPEERMDLLKIISQTSLKGELISESHYRFWEIVDTNEWTKEDVKDLWDRVLGRTCVRQRYFILAVMDAFYNGNDRKTQEFQDYEEYLVKKGILPPEEIKKTDEFIYKVAHRIPVVLEDIFGGAWQEKVLDEESMRGYRVAFDQLDRQYRSLQQLFDRKGKGYQ